MIFAIFCVNDSPSLLRALSQFRSMSKGPGISAAFAFYQNFSDAPKGEKSRFLNTLRIQDLKGP